MTLDDMQQNHQAVSNLMYSVLDEIPSTNNQDALLVACSNVNTVPLEIKQQLTEEQLQLVPGVAAAMTVAGW